MLFYTSIVSPGYFAQKGGWAWLVMFSAIISRVAPYAKHPDVKGGFFFDLETMEPLVNTPGWVEGVKDFVEAQDYMPPGGNNFGLGDEIFSFGGGQTLFSYSWDDAFVQAMEPKSRTNASSQE